MDNKRKAIINKGTAGTPKTKRFKLILKTKGFKSSKLISLFDFIGQAKKTMSSRMDSRLNLLHSKV